MKNLHLILSALLIATPAFVLGLTACDSPDDVNLAAEEFADALLSHPHRLRGEPDPCAPPPPRRAVGAVLCALLGAALCVGASGLEQLAYFWVAWMCTMIVRDALGLPQIEAPL